MTEWGYLDLSEFKPPRISREWSQPIEAPRNRVTSFPINLNSEEGGQLAPGLYFVEIDSPEFWRLFQPPRQQPFRAVVIVGTANLTMKRSSTGELLVWATDLRSGEPVANVDIRVYDSSKQQIGTAQTDADGLARFANLPTQDQNYYGFWRRLQPGSYAVERGLQRLGIRHVRGFPAAPARQLHVYRSAHLPARSSGVFPRRRP
jgi:hypothetical protein